MIAWMTKSFFTFLGKLIRVSLTAICLFLTLCMNALTIPFFALSSTVCSIFRIKRPRFGGYGLMVYPKWSNQPNGSMLSDIKRYDEKQQAKIKKPTPIRAWEEIFFY